MCCCRVQLCNEYKSALQARFFVDARRTNRATMYVTCASLTLQLQAVHAHATYASQLASVLRAASSKVDSRPPRVQLNP